MSSRTFFNTGCVVDNNSLPLVPIDIPLKPDSQLFPSTIYGDGNCLPRCVSVLVYGNEDHHIEMRRRMVVELTRNESNYLDNTFMKNGKQDSGQSDVPKAFAHLSSMYMGQQLTKNVIKTLYEKEVLNIRKSGAWMGLWQIASIANILGCPVVSVCPTYGTQTVRRDMHRVFYPFNEELHASPPVFIMWTSLGGVRKEEKDFSLNHFDVLMPMAYTDTVDVDLSDYMVDDSFELSDSANSSILNIIADLMIEDNGSQLITEKHDLGTSNTAYLPDTETSVPPETGNLPSRDMVDTAPIENDETVKQSVQTSEPRCLGPDDIVRPIGEITRNTESTEGQDIDAKSPERGGDTFQAARPETRCMNPDDTGKQKGENRNDLTYLTEGQDIDAKSPERVGDTLQAAMPETRCMNPDDTGKQKGENTHDLTFLTEGQDIDAKSPERVGDTLQAARPETRCMGPYDTSGQTAEITQNTDLTEEQDIDAENDGVTIPAASFETRCKTGDYVMIQHGQSFIPAVVDHWPWVKFFNKGKKKGFWTLSEIQHTVLAADVDHTLPPPDITMCGTRLLYHFPEYNQKKQKHM